ncbi:MAG: CbiX/SirB N-terminal domain-containing protein [Verrucomicrobiae bacterium]
MNTSCLILFGHGSKNSQWAEPFRKLAADLRNDLGNNGVFLCFLEHSEPSLMEIAPEIMKAGIRTARLLPLFMAKGGHFHEDIPAQIAAMKTKFPGIDVELMEPIGLRPEFFDLMRCLIKSLA